MTDADKSKATDDEITYARENYADDDLQIDEGAEASRADDGVWVQAWVWVPYDETGDDEGED